MEQKRRENIEVLLKDNREKKKPTGTTLRNSSLIREKLKPELDFMFETSAITPEGSILQYYYNPKNENDVAVIEIDQNLCSISIDAEGITMSGYDKMDIKDKTTIDRINWSLQLINR